jgi:hypothetical protein
MWQNSRLSRNPLFYFPFSFLGMYDESIGGHINQDIPIWRWAHQANWGLLQPLNYLERQVLQV